MKNFINFTVDFHDGLKVWWDGATRAYIDAPPSYRDNTLGLCGTFNSNMEDDFRTLEGTLSFSLRTFSSPSIFFLLFCIFNLTDITQRTL